jgi:hypothetical protein
MTKLNDRIWEIVGAKVGYGIDCDVLTDQLIDAVEQWLPKEQSAAGSQNVYVECAVEGFNDCLNKLKYTLK